MPDFGSHDWYEEHEVRLGPDAAEINEIRLLRVSPGDDEIDWAAERPLITRSSQELIALAENGLSRSWPAIELPTLALHEAKHRRPGTFRKIQSMSVVR